ncbi:GGDEF domain-containing protein [Qipengyuania flava]|uniref:GGDEF domain-containing protein n=1 Tax=Qipengyuania flava TaxID=192812 RepID=UPI001C6366A3|nr:GGDEF domain-containing protein [Qipengyuania flava]QYJ08268.1 GGDEF domain-containing protein [Qipengyuania flava]
MREQIMGLITPTMAIVFCAVFVVLWWRGKMGNYVLGFAAAYLFFAMGFGVTHLFDTGSPYVFHVTQFFYTLATGAALWGLAKRAGQPHHLGAILIIYALAAATLFAAILNSNDISSRLVIVNMGYGAMKLVTVMVLMNAHRREAIDKLIIFTQAVFAAQFFIRPVLTLTLEQGIPAEVYRESIYYSVLNLSLALISLMGAMVLVGACVYDQIKAVREQAELDGLTGLRTRRAFEQDVVELLEKSKQGDIPVSLVVADIDHFKAVNDVWGHQIGDNAIAQFGEIIEGTIRDTDIAGRIGGEEFCILAWNCEGEAAVKLAERIRVAFAKTQIRGMPEDHRLTASFGVAGRGEGEGYGRMFARTDAALYRAKEEGRNRTVGDRVGVATSVVTPINKDVADKREARA